MKAKERFVLSKVLGAVILLMCETWVIASELTEQAIGTQVVRSIEFSQQKRLSREFKSDNGEYLVTVDYEKYGGEGGAYYTIKNKKGELISKFTTDIAPCEIYISNNGERIIAFGGNWMEIAFINKMVFYDFNGNIIKKYILNIPIKPYMEAIKLSKEGNVLVMGLWYDLIDYLGHLNRDKMIRVNMLVLFDVITGNIIKQLLVKDIETAVSRIAVSENAEWIILSGPTGKGWDEKVILIDKNGKKHWEKLWKQKNPEGSFRVKDISSDGKTFEFEEHRGKSIKKFIYRNIKGSIKLEKIIENKNQEY